MPYTAKFIFAAALAFMILSCAGTPAPATGDDADRDRLEAQQLVEKSQLTFNNFITDPRMRAMRDLLPKARAVFIMPQQLKGALIIGAGGGSGVLVQRAANTDEWTGPAFYTAAGASLGLQVGGQAAEIVLLIMSERGIAAFMSNSLKLGVDAGIAVGPMGVGGSAATANLSADILSFAKAKGLYGGVALDGVVVTPRDKWNSAFYGKPVKPSEILVRASRVPRRPVC
jgi:lipid-binding SYLF domain-containing protein